MLIVQQYSTIFNIDSLSYIISIIHYNLTKTEWVEAIHVSKSLMMLVTTNVLHIINLNNKFHFLWNWCIEETTMLYKAHDCIALAEPDRPWLVFLWKTRKSLVLMGTSNYNSHYIIRAFGIPSSASYYLLHSTAVRLFWPSLTKFFHTFGRLLYLKV